MFFIRNVKLSSLQWQWSGWHCRRFIVLKPVAQGPPSGFEESMMSIMACKPIPNQTKCMQIMSKKEIVSFGTPKAPNWKPIFCCACCKMGLRLWSKFLLFVTISCRLWSLICRSMIAHNHNTRKGDNKRFVLNILEIYLLISDKSGKEISWKTHKLFWNKQTAQVFFAITLFVVNRKRLQSWFLYTIIRVSAPDFKIREACVVLRIPVKSRLRSFA